MNLLDILLVLIIAYCLVRGVFRGLVKELSSIIGVLGGVYAAYSYYDHVAKLLSKWITNPIYLNLLSCIILFFSVYLMVSIIGTMIKYLMNIVFLGWTDRICGAFFGALKGALICAAFILVLTTFLPNNTPLLRESLAVRRLMKVSTTLVKSASNDVKEVFGIKSEGFGIKMEGLNRAWRANLK
jgi:membrane protein required for colicin V production